MYNVYQKRPCLYPVNSPNYNSGIMCDAFRTCQCHCCYYSSRSNSEFPVIQLKDYGPKPFAVNINEAAKQNTTFRTALWTGNHLQLTLMSIPVGENIGLEIHPDIDQFIRIEEGRGIVKMGRDKNNLDFQRNVSDDFAIFIPSDTWHDIINTGSIPLKVYSIYAPPQHPFGTVHVTKSDAEAAERSCSYCFSDEQWASRQTREFTLSQLAQYNGTMGKPAYVAVNGIVYDVSGISKWSGGTHHGLTAGKDLSSQFEGCHGDLERLAKLPKVGILRG